MASHKRCLSNPHSPWMDEPHLWLSDVKDRIMTELFSESENEVSIFIVPKTLMIISPNCYTPQHVALGPNHFWHPELHHNDEDKIAAAKRVHQQLQSRNLNFKGLVEKFTKHDVHIRACYQRFIYFKTDVLVLLMAIDSAFVLEFLQLIYSREDGKKHEVEAEITSNKPTGGSLSFTSVEIHSAESTSMEVPTEANTLPTFTHHLYGRSTLARNAIVRDMLMLENQIPLFLLTEMLKYQFSSEESADNMLYAMLKAFRKKFCPFKSIKDLEKATVLQRAHFLDYMYRTILPDDEPTSCLPSDLKDQSFKNRTPFKNATAISRLLSMIKQLLRRHVRNEHLREVIEDIKLFVDPKLKSKGSSVGSDCNSQKPPEISIPSVTELARVGIRFSPIKDGDKFTTIKFDATKATFYLPPIRLDGNTEVILRNLVAYEASRHRSSYFTRYTDLMNGIIDTAEDVMLLKERGIIQNHLKSDEEAAKIWNGIISSMKKKKVINLDKHIKNHYKKKCHI